MAFGMFWLTDAKGMTLYGVRPPVIVATVRFRPERISSISQAFQNKSLTQILNSIRFGPQWFAFRSIKYYENTYPPEVTQANCVDLKSHYRTALR